MRKSFRRPLACAVTLALLALTPVAVADPGEDHSDEIPVPAPSQPTAGAGIERMQLLDVADKDGTINSDIAFYGDLAYVGNYDGFRIIDISDPSDLRVVSDTKCRANQGDVSVFAGSNGRRYLLQSIDRAVDAPDCSAKDTPIVQETDEFGVSWARARFGWEGLRLFDVTNPEDPQYLHFFRTECGSHTHTLVPDGRRIQAYVASYPLLSQITPEIDRDAAGSLFCDAPHSKVSIVSMPLSDPASGTVKAQPLHADTEFYDHDGPTTRHEHDGVVEYHGTAPAFQSCHDHQAFMPRQIVVASCAGDLQYWDTSDPANPSSDDRSRLTLIQREAREDDPTTPQNERLESFDFMHNATVTWDGAVVAAVDEAGGGVQARCDGSSTQRGFTFFYPLVEPGTPVDGFADMLGRYVIPRPQGSQVCVSHNGNVLPTNNGRYWQVQAFYQGGNSWFDFTNPAQATELGWADLEGGAGGADSWSTYWYNGVVYANGGLGGRNGSNRGFEAYAMFDEAGKRVRTRSWRWLNPQTQEASQLP